MSFEADYEYALELHKLLNSSSPENNNDNDIKCVDFKKPSQIKFKKKAINPRSNLDADHIYRMKNLWHPQCEFLNPTPNIVVLFNHFDNKFFQNRLKCVTLEWGKRMHSCAGICYSRKYCDEKDITVRLSEPLLALRQRKDLIETMLHEMIHAYCFVLHIRESNGGHGPQFKKIMNAVNKVTGTNITVYHTFRDEIKSCNLYWWCCNGVCQERSPFYGHVIRTTSDAPGPADIWWAKHREECGGTLMKIKGPPVKLRSKKIKKSNKEKKKSSAGSSESRENFSSELDSTNVHLINAAGRSKSNDLGAMSLCSTASVAKAFPPTSYPGLSSDPFSVLINRPNFAQTFSSSSVPRGNSHNIVGLKDVGTRSKPSTSNASDWGKGTSLSQESDQHSTSENHIDRQFLRSVWEKRWNGGIGNRQKHADESGPTVDIKRKRISNDATPSCPSDVTCTSVEGSSCARNQADWVAIDEDVMVRENSSDDVINLSSGEDNDDQDDEEYEIYTATINQKMTSAEIQKVIKKEIIDESIDLCETDIELIDDEFDDNFEQSYEMTASNELPDTSAIDKYFGSSNFLKEFQKDNDLIASGSRLNSSNEIVTCPICETKMSRWQFAKHLNGCTGITLKIQPPKLAFKNLATATKEKGRERFSSETARNRLRNTGYLDSDLTQTDLLTSFSEDDDRVLNNTFFEISDIEPSENNTIDLSSSPDDEDIKHRRQRSIYKTTWQCPRCAREIEETDVNDHSMKCARKGNKNPR
uniref:Protein with SprT-like domain at the N terminus n=1 Tax=Glossina austeni TaxID=7395 RepID=A0A1A9VRW9_GLOAU